MVEYIANCNNATGPLNKVYWGCNEEAIISIYRVQYVLEQRIQAAM